MQVSRSDVSQITQNSPIQSISALVEKRMRGEGSGHDWFHVERVRTMALRLARTEQPCDYVVVELAALLHDIPDRKLHPNPQEAMQELCGWLRGAGFDSALISHVSEIIEGVSYRGAGIETPMRTMEGRVVQDADRLDALGAVGVARCFAYGGKKGRLLYDPACKPRMHSDAESYHTDEGPSLNHFYEKLLLLRDRMLTESGKKAAAKRHRFLERYIAEFLSEWSGLDLPD